MGWLKRVKGKGERLKAEEGKDWRLKAGGWRN